VELLTLLRNFGRLKTGMLSWQERWNDYRTLTEKPSRVCSLIRGQSPSVAGISKEPSHEGTGY